MNDGDGHTGPPATRTPSSVPAREDCWSEHATRTLVDAWGDRYLELNRGNLRHHHWKEVANAVNSVHGHIKKARRSDVQCKNRIDTLKKRYKIEKARVSSGYVSYWTFFLQLDHLIGPSYKPSPPQPPELPHRKNPPALPPPPLPELPNWTVPVGPRSKRPVSGVSPAIVRRNFSAMAAAAAAAEAEEGEESETSKSSGGGSEGERRGVEWYRVLAEAIERVGEIYGRVEEAKQRQMVEMEKQRMEFAKDLEIQRMRIFVDGQIQLERIKRAKKKRRSSESDSYL
ncbi:hypothetical protein Vadar_014793 [Vaccinium darrowii]|uniref:Uncharacterized protein n=1 Tax=Vaccinium darrowii TaxID=229202 RepID=A0ACB7Z4Q7_9ERIC|nr:hypothetical protein Vadar_014793 [Vaccinium darrowii]